MTESKQMQASESHAPGAGDPEEEYYEEPPRMSALDAIGVFVALVLLAVIGVGGYVWLTPGLGFGDLLPHRGKAADEGMAVAAADSGAHQDAPAASTEHVKCAQCGMFADKSASHIQASWSDGSSTDHDSWGCAVGYAADHGLTLTAARVVDYDSALKEDHAPQWLDAASAWYIYDAQSVPGSMPPHVAAFPNKQAAAAAHPQLGGEVVDFAGLAEQLGFSSFSFGHGGADSAPPHEPHHDVAMEHSDAADQHADMQMHTEHGTESTMPPAEAEPAADMHADTGRLDPLAAPETHDHDMSCPTCGMPANASPSQVVVIWSNGDHEHFDSWDCLFARAADQGLTIVRAVARVYGDMDQEPRWVNVQHAWYLYDTSKIKMSMPPYVAAFETAADAKAAQPELGGELVSFAELKAHWE